MVIKYFRFLYEILKYCSVFLWGNCIIFVGMDCMFGVRVFVFFVGGLKIFLVRRKGWKLL